MISGKYLRFFYIFRGKLDKCLIFCDIACECSRIQERRFNMKNSTAIAAISGASKLQTPRPHTRLAPGLEREPLCLQGFPAFLKRASPLPAVKAMQKSFQKLTHLRCEISGYGGVRTVSPDQASAIYHMLSRNSLFIFCANAEFIINQEQILDLHRASISRDFSRGCVQTIRPVEGEDGGTYFFHPNSVGISEFRYYYERNSYEAHSFTKYCGHLIKNPKSASLWKGDEVFQTNILFFVNSDGTLIAATLKLVEKIMAFMEVVSDGPFDAICAVERDIYCTLLVSNGVVLRKFTGGSYTDNGNNFLSLIRTLPINSPGATFLTRAQAVSPQAVKSFDDATVLKAELIHAQIEGGATAENALNRANKALDPSGRAGMEFLQKNLKDQRKNSDKFYGKQVGPDVYGSNGVEEYRRMVDAFFLLNGGDRDSAVKTARARMDSEYAETHIGADRHWRMPFFGARRRKFKNTPEAVYGPNAAGIINLDLEAMVPQISKMSGIPCDLDHIILVPTPETDRAVEMGEDPTWRILRSNGDGTSQFYTDGDGNPLIYSLSEGVQRAIYLADLNAAKIEKEEDLGFADLLNPWLDRIITPMGRRAFENLPSWVLSGLGRAFEKTSEFVTGTPIPAETAYKLVKENEMRMASSVIGVIRKAWEDPGTRKRELVDLLSLGLKPKTPPKATRKEWDVARRK
jgi:hypothetical protein